jgi:hypothetical protein
MPNPFSVAFEGHFAHTISRPFRANRFIGCFPGLKPWAKFFSPSGAIKEETAETSLIFAPFSPAFRLQAKPDLKIRSRARNILLKNNSGTWADVALEVAKALSVVV